MLDHRLSIAVRPGGRLDMQSLSEPLEQNKYRDQRGRFWDTMCLCDNKKITMIRAGTQENQRKGRSGVYRR